MAEPISIQQLKDASEDAISLADFINKPENVMIPRRLASDINSLQYYLDYMSSYAQHSYETYDEMVANAANLPSGVSAFVTNDLDTTKNGFYTYNGTDFVKGEYQPENAAKEFVEAKLDGLPPFEGGVLADTFVTATANGVGTIARTQRAKNSDSITPYDFGVIGSYNADTLADRFATLADAQAVYSNAVALTELADRVAFDRFLLYLIANRCTGADWTCELLIEKPLVSYKSAKTLLINGDLEIKPLETIDYKIPYVLHIATNAVVTTGAIRIAGRYSFPDMKTRKIIEGVVLGQVTVQGVVMGGTAQNCEINYVECRNILGYAFTFGTNCHFSAVKQIRGSSCGSAVHNTDNPTLGNVRDTFTVISQTRGDINQEALISVPNMQYTADMHNIYGRLAYINGEPYHITNADFTAKTLTLYPHLPSDVTSGNIDIIFGGTLAVFSNNTACTSVGTVQSITSGLGVYMGALYGTNIGNLITEFNGAGISVGRKYEIVIGNTVGVGYFEGNTIDIVYAWGQLAYSSLKINQDIALSASRVWQLYAYRMPDNTRRYDYSMMGSGMLHIGDTQYAQETTSTVLNIQSTSKNDVLRIRTATYQLAYSQKLAGLTGRESKVITFIASTTVPVITLKAPTGMTIDGSTDMTLDVSKYGAAVDILFYVANTTSASTDIKTVIMSKPAINKGTTAQRPTTPTLGQKYYDTTLLASGKPIEWNGTAWVDSAGTVV